MHDRREGKDELVAYLHQQAVLIWIVVKQHWKVAWSVYSGAIVALAENREHKVCTNLGYFGVKMNTPLDLITCVGYKLEFNRSPRSPSFPIGIK
jgi:hypothetical protein